MTRLPRRLAPQTSRRPRRAHRGAVLLTGLIILLVMTVLGLSSVRSLVLNERMAGNVYDEYTAFQAAEAGVQAALSFIEGQRAPVVPTANGSSKVWPGCEVTDGAGGGADCDSDGGSSHACCLLEAMLADWEDGSFSEGVALGSFGGAALSDVATADQPRVLIESRYIPPLDVEAASKGAGVHFYTITAVGAGRKDSGLSVVQTTIPKVYSW